MAVTLPSLVVYYVRVNTEEAVCVDVGRAMSIANSFLTVDTEVKPDVAIKTMTFFDESFLDTNELWLAEGENSMDDYSLTSDWFATKEAAMSWASRYLDGEISVRRFRIYR